MEYIRVKRKHHLFLLIADMIVQISGICWEVSVIVHNVVGLRMGRELPMCSNHNPNGIFNPFVRFS